jgi:FkbM family methyltransferase
MGVSGFPESGPRQTVELAPPPGRGIRLFPEREAWSALRKLRPTKLRNALRRRWFELRLNSLPLRPAPGVARVGSDYGGWNLPTGLIGDGWTCYCAGAGGDVSLDLELISRFGATVRSLEPVAEFVDAAIEEAAGESRFSALQAAVATADGPLLMQRSHDVNSRSVSSVELYETSEYVELPGRTIGSLMTELGDERIELLKLDVEGAEYELMPTLDLRGLGVQVLGVQLHHVGSLREARELLGLIRRQGFELVACRPAVRLAFVRTELL